MTREEYIKMMKDAGFTEEEIKDYLETADTLGEPDDYSIFIPPLIYHE